ncbi:hypothetical protein BV22DRAFT_1030261 [Leucogyrophana mollusca]|uniref:Uncharacterized protein n=1 Tax=Leucogyrophana mollusca TaxID=85980 RepID=A0ACB8BSE2_9AGAM|nr:hypothetical protein BV22DRAFT_1030261 [Leucogyrophana mollusca]
MACVYLGRSDSVKYLAWAGETWNSKSKSTSALKPTPVHLHLNMDPTNRPQGPSSHYSLYQREAPKAGGDWEMDRRLSVTRKGAYLGGNSITHQRRGRSFVIKGIQHINDAIKARELGYEGIVMTSHASQ